jgi:hypothetical protein
VTATINGDLKVLQSIFDMKGKNEGGDVIATAAGYWSVSLGLQMTGIIHSCRFLPQDGYQVEETTENSRIECTLHQGIMPTPTPYLLTVPTEVPAEPILGNADAIAGAWSGTVSGGNYSFQVSIAIGEGCTIDSVCGPFDIPAIPCSGTLILTGIAGATYEFKEGSAQGSCGQDVLWTLTLLPDGTLTCVSRGESWEERGILKGKE